MSSPTAFRAPTGTHDVLPPDSARWESLIGLFSSLASRAGYGMVATPLFEELAVFSRGVGTSTDIVAKEMYEFEDRGGRRMALRPEVTASVVRAFIQHRPPTPWKVWYWGPNFRYERPQAGRYRQFFQLGVEALGTPDPALDVEVVALAVGLCGELGLTGVRTLVNSLGDSECRPAYRAALISFLEPRQDRLCPEHQTRWRENPLRVLDCKKEPCLTATAGAPAQLDNLCSPCGRHWERVLAGLGALGVEYQIEPRLVRGLDYYTRTTFEFAATSLESAQNAVGGGGRYDGLTEMLGGPPTPAIGFSLGIERLLLACDAEKVFAVPDTNLDVFVVDMVGGEEATLLTDELRRAGLRADRAFVASTDGPRSPRSQLRAADRSGASLAVIVGEEEVAGGVATVKQLRGGEQEQVPRARLIARVRDLLEAEAVG